MSNTAAYEFIRPDDMPGVTFFSIAETRPTEETIGVGVDLSTSKITHLILWSDKTPNVKALEPKGVNYPVLSEAGFDYLLVGEKLAEPIDAKEFLVSRKVHPDLQNSLERALRGEPGYGKPDIKMANKDNDKRCHINRGNCYAYAVSGEDKGASNKYTTTPLLQPGNSKPGFKEVGAATITAENVEQGMVRDGCEKIVGGENIEAKDLPQKEGHYIVAAFMMSKYDFHFLRQEKDKTWSHRLEYDISDKDAHGKLITDPLKANLNYKEANYDTFIGYFYVPNKGITVDISQKGKHSEAPSPPLKYVEPAMEKRGVQVQI